MKSLSLLILFISAAGTAGCGRSGGASAKGGNGGGAGTGGIGGGAGTIVDAGGSGGCTFTACGGDIVGTWRPATICPTEVPACPASTSLPVTSAGAITYTFASDGSFTYAASGALTETLRYPDSCVSSASDGGLVQACAAYGTAMQGSIDNSDGGSAFGPSSFTCSAESDTCVCQEVLKPVSQTDTGTYTTSRNQLTVMVTSVIVGDAGVDAGTFPVWDYCVSGSTLTLRSVSISGNYLVTTMTR